MSRKEKRPEASGVHGSLEFGRIFRESGRGSGIRFERKLPYKDPGFPGSVQRRGRHV